MKKNLKTFLHLWCKLGEKLKTPHFSIFLITYYGHPLCSRLHL